MVLKSISSMNRSGCLHHRPTAATILYQVWMVDFRKNVNHNAEWNTKTVVRAASSWAKGNYNSKSPSTILLCKIFNGGLSFPCPFQLLCAHWLVNVLTLRYSSLPLCTQGDSKWLQHSSYSSSLLVPASGIHGKTLLFFQNQWGTAITVVVVRAADIWGYGNNFVTCSSFLRNTMDTAMRFDTATPDLQRLYIRPVPYDIMIRLCWNLGKAI